MDCFASLAVTALLLLLRLPLLRRLSLPAGLLRHLLSLGTRLGQSDRDRLLAALDRLAGATALQGAGLALLHRAFDVSGSLLGIFGCHGSSPVVRKLIHAGCEGS